MRAISIRTFGSGADCTREGALFPAIRRKCLIPTRLARPEPEKTHTRLSGEEHLHSARAENDAVAVDWSLMGCPSVSSVPER